MSTTRLLILGALRANGEAHGYEVRRELEAWGAENWGNIAYGSIYHAIKQMSSEGLIEPIGTESVKGRPARTAYALTDRGEQEFMRILREHWWELEPIVDPFQAALTFMDSLPRKELLAALNHRAATCRSAVEKILEYGVPSKRDAGVSHHIEETLRLYASYVEAQARWAEETAAKVERRELP